MDGRKMFGLGLRFHENPDRRLPRGQWWHFSYGDFSSCQSSLRRDKPDKPSGGGESKLTTAIRYHLEPNRPYTACQMIQQRINEDHDPQHLECFLDRFADHVWDRGHSIHFNYGARDDFHT